MIPKLRYFMTILASFFLVILVWTFALFFHFKYISAIDDPQGVKYIVKPGSSMSEVIHELAQTNIIKHPVFFKLIVDIKKASHRLKTGEYFFRKGISSAHILRQITTGTGLYYYKFTIIPGWTFKELRQALMNDLNLRQSISNLSDQVVMAQLGKANLNPEGQFYPDTYFFTNGADDLSILRRSLKIMATKLDLAWKNKAPHLPYKNAYEALIAASLVEKETYYENEMPRVAGVLVNRLQKGMRLEFDPSVIFGVGRFDGRITKKDLQANNPYNTYLHKGLPPTPIAIPSSAALQATLHPEQHQFYFFVAGQDKNSHFSKDLSSHHALVVQTRRDRWYFNFLLIHNYLVKYFSLYKVSFR